MLFLAFYGKKTFFKIFQNWSKLFLSTNFMTHYMFKLLKTQKYAWKMVVYVISELWKTPPLSHPASHIWDAPYWTKNTTLISKYFKIIVWYVLWDCRKSNLQTLVDLTRTPFWLLFRLEFLPLNFISAYAPLSMVFKILKVIISYQIITCFYYHFRCYELEYV